MPHVLESRLYLYPDPATRTIHILGIGDKTSQQTDINAAKKQIETIKKSPTPAPQQKP